MASDSKKSDFSSGGKAAEPELDSDLPAYAPNDPAASIDLDTDALIAYITSTYPASPTPAPTTLPFPLCLPQMNSGPTSLFVRAYSPALADAGVSVDVWMHFVCVLFMIPTTLDPFKLKVCAYTVTH